MCFLLLKQKVMIKAPLFDHFWANNNFSGKSIYVVILFLDPYCCGEFQKKVMDRF